MVAIKGPKWALLKGPHVRGGSTPYCSTVQYSTVQYSTVQYSTVQYRQCPDMQTAAAWPPDLASQSGT